MSRKRKRGGRDEQGAGDARSKIVKKEMLPLDLSSNSKPSLEIKPFAEIPLGEDRKREADLYEMLGSVVEDTRNDAAECIVSSLLQGDGASEAVLERHLNRRLFRGLASGREGSRLGFSVVITEILSQLFSDSRPAKAKYPGLTFDRVLGMLADRTQAVGNISGQEERDHYFGQLFGLECFVKCKSLFKNDMNRWNAVLEMLLKLGSKKIWLRPQCGWILVQALEQMSEEATKATLCKVADVGMAKTSEGVAAWIVSLNRYPKLQLPPWNNPLSNKSLGDLAAVLKESFKESARDPKDKQIIVKHASWSAQLHFVWDIISARFLSASRNPKEEDFQQFWSRVVDDGLFSKQATDGQKFKGFMVFEKMLKGFCGTPNRIQALFSRNFMSCLLNQASKEDRYLHRAATKALKAIEEVVLSYPATLPPILASLLGKNGTYAFDQRTNSKTVDRLLQNINEQNLDSVLAIVSQPIELVKKQEVTEAQSTLRTYCDYLAKILNASASASSQDENLYAKDKKPIGKRKDATTDKARGFFDKALQELTIMAYGKPAEVPKDILTDQIREMCRSRLDTALAKLSRSTDFTAICKAVASIDSSSMPMSFELIEARDAALVRMSKLSKSKSGAAQGLALLHAISIFQLYNEDPDAMEVLDDLCQCYGKLRSGLEDVRTGEGGSEILVEILLSMVARPSSLMRQISQQVFSVFTSQMSADSIELLTGPLASGESTKGQKELFNDEDGDDAMELGSDVSEDGEDEDGFIEVEDVSDFEMDSDIEFMGLNGDDEVGEDENDDSNEESKDKDDDVLRNEDEKKKNEGKLNEDGEWEKPEELDEILGKILKSHRLDKDTEAQSSEDEGDMSDAQMFALDEQLSAAIAPRIKATKTDKKKQEKDARQSVVNFKHRILDLLDIYVKNEPFNPLTFSILLPLLNLLRCTSTRSLINRASQVIFDLRKALKKTRSGAPQGGARDSPAETLLPLLMECHEEAGKDDSQAYAKAASAACLIVASTIFKQNRESIEQIAAVYAKTEAAWVLNKAKMHGSFFKEWHDWVQSMRDAR